MQAGQDVLDDACGCGKGFSIWSSGFGFPVELQQHDLRGLTLGVLKGALETTVGAKESTEGMPSGPSGLQRNGRGGEVERELVWQEPLRVGAYMRAE
jgi:hypothetical protein